MSAVPCPGCSRSLGEPEVEIQQADVEAVTIGITCSSCGTSFPVTVGPTDDNGVAVVG